MQRAVRLMAIVAVVMARFIPCAEGGLRDIHPRPQQMGLLADQPLAVPGTFYLVLPNNLTPDEIYVRDEALSRIEDRVSRVPILLSWSQYSGQTPALLMGTDERMPALANALDTMGVAGLGTFTHSEEYQVYVGGDRILLCGNDLRGLRWGLMSLVELMAETGGTMYVDRAYLRDWPDFPQRVITINCAIRNQEQADMVNQIADLGYSGKMNEVEWNEHDGGRNMSPFALSHSLEVRDKLRRRGVALTMSTDRTAIAVDEKQFQEGLPMAGTKMRVASDGTLNVIPGGFNLTVANGSFESWSDGLPTSWIVYQPAYVAWIARDQTNVHSGTSSAKFYNLSSAPDDLDLRRNHMVVGDHRYLRVKFWYKLSEFSGVVRARFHGPPPVDGKMDERLIYFPDPTTQDWTPMEFNFTSGYTDSITIFLGIFGSCNGTVWFDDISFESGTVEQIVRRPDTPLSIYKLPTNLLMVEGLDYQITDTSGASDVNYCTAPRFTRLTAGRLASGDSVTMDWHSAVQYQSVRRTVCFSLPQPLLAYQDRVRRLDSLMHPDGFKIHINEVSYANYDVTCTSRGMSPGQLVGSFCQEMYNIIQSYRPGAPVRIYGDPVDIWVHDPRLHPITQPPWTAGSLEQLAPAVQIMAMIAYTSNLDSSLAYFQANGHTSLVSGGGGGPQKSVQGAIVARRWPGTVRGMQFYDWDINAYLREAPDLADLAWNMGPFISHTPVVFTSQPSSVLIRAEMWTDSFQTGQAPILTSKQLRYRLLPSGSWVTVNLNNDGTDAYSATVSLTGPGITGIEYYLMTTDYRGQTRMAPYNAPSETFVAMFPGESGPNGLDPEYHELEYVVTDVSGNSAVEWDPAPAVDYYEVHYGSPPQLVPESPTLLATQQPYCPRYLISDEEFKHIEMERLHVYAVRLPPDYRLYPRKQR